MLYSKYTYDYTYSRICPNFQIHKVRLHSMVTTQTSGEILGLKALSGDLEFVARGWIQLCRQAPLQCLTAGLWAIVELERSAPARASWTYGSNNGIPFFTATTLVIIPLDNPLQHRIVV